MLLQQVHAIETFDISKTSEKSHHPYCFCFVSVFDVGQKTNTADAIFALETHKKFYGYGFIFKEGRKLF